MKVTFRQSFVRYLKKVKTQAVLDRVRRAIEQVEATSTTQEVGDLKKMSGAGNFYRIRVGDYRLPNASSIRICFSSRRPSLSGPKETFQTTLSKSSWATTISLRP